jgi:hypothetical protein
LNENVATTNWNQTVQSGKVTEGLIEYEWTLHSEPWTQSTTNIIAAGSSPDSTVSSSQPAVNASVINQTTLSLLSVEVGYYVQNQRYNVRLTTLAIPQQ